MQFSPQQFKTYQRRLQSTVRFLKKTFGAPPKLAVVFGSGLGKSFLSQLKSAKRLSYAKIPHFDSTAVAGHQGQLHWMTQPWPLLVLQGRKHYYEGLSPQEVVFPYRALALWGVPRVILTNASGSLKKNLRVGSLVCLKDHLNFTGANPLSGPNLDELGPRFPALTSLYENALSKALLRAARQVRVALPRGVYVGISGPSYETPAEIRAYQRLGGDLVGMSTIFEAIACAHGGMEVAALAAVTNVCLNTREAPNHESVLAQAGKVDEKLAKVLLRLIQHGLKG